MIASDFQELEKAIIKKEKYIFTASMVLEKLNNPNTIIVVGRAHSGTRLLPESLTKAGQVFMGEPKNKMQDLLPEHVIYKACRIFGPNVEYKGNFEWDFSRVNTMPIPDKFLSILEEYLQSLLKSDHKKLGWKIPNNNLIYPWLIRIFPKAKFIHWIRHPEGSCSAMTGVDRLEKWGIPAKKFLFHSGNYKIRVVSWKYHYDIIHQSPKPENFLRIRFEDFISDQQTSAKRVSDFLDIKPEPLEIDPNRLVPSKKDLRRKYPFLKSAMDELGY